MRKFKTESKRLLDLMINSIYTNEEIFLRELISNASDAVDKLYFRSLTDPAVKLSQDELRIEVSFNKEERTITVSDSGLGMTEEELDRNLGTIAHSGSLEFKEGEAAAGSGATAGAGAATGETAAAEGAASTGDADKGDTDPGDTPGKAAGKGAAATGDAEKAVPPRDIDIIGQFGVGFYSAFMVSKDVKVVSRAFDSDTAFVWESDGVRGYNITAGQRESHGTDVILTLRDNTEENNYDAYLSEYKLKSLIRRYSNYIRYPIQMETTHTRELPKPDDAGEDYQPEYESYTEQETVNSMIPIWKRSKAEVTQEEYDEFYKSDFHDFEKPIRTVSVHAEGALSYDALLFVPGRAPYDFYSKDFKKGLALYSANVLIMEKCEELLPDCFSFVRGVVDSQDLTLNISRETLQHNSQLRAIERKIEKKVKSDLADMRDNDREAYEAFFEDFGRTLKYGIYMSYGMQKELLADLLLFYSAKQKKMITLDEYLDAAAADQASVFYAAGGSVERLAKMPVVTSVLGRGYDVLLCTQDVDEFSLSAMMEYREKPFKNVAGGDLGLETEEEKAQAEEAAKENEALFAAIKEALGDKVGKVAVSTRLTDAPVTLTAEGPISLEMEKILSQMPDGKEVKSERVLELNVKHPVFEVMKAAQEAGEAEKVERYAGILYNQALLVEGLPIEDPLAFADSIASLMV
ncbi:MAG: molecular chaperone HtpG [Coriobacteriaceae bacterium]|nr:molecular chaperone HtpG [Coriobacteriaceae bacterium]